MSIRYDVRSLSQSDRRSARPRPPEGELPHYHQAARFPGEEVTETTSFAAQETLFAHAGDVDLSAYRVQRNRVDYVVIVGEPPPTDLHDHLRAMLATGASAVVPEDVLRRLQARRTATTQDGPWVEGHYRPGKRLPSPTKAAGVRSTRASARVPLHIYVYSWYDAGRGAMTTMAKAPVTITIDPDSELGRALDESIDEPVVLQRGTTRFRVIRDPDDPWAQYDPDKIRAALRTYAGMITPEEADRIKEGIYRGREEGTRPLTRP
jgi:hypothetical protein